MVAQSAVMHLRVRTETPVAETRIRGFHLAGFQTNEIQEVIDMLNALEIQKIGPCHCTGDRAFRMFADKYAENFIKASIGKEILV